MSDACRSPSRRTMLKTIASGAIGPLLVRPSAAVAETDDDKALIAITLDLEMSRHYPTWGMTEWDYEKGNLNDESKRYAVEAARRVKARGGVVHFFALGRTLEQPDVQWLIDILAQEHPIGNHTYDHVNILAKCVNDLQYRFQRAPWLLRGMTVPEAIRDNIAITTTAMEKRLGKRPVGFRTPGGFRRGLVDRPDLQELLLRLGFDWVSSVYPAHPIGAPDEPPTQAVYDEIIESLRLAQPFRYGSGLVEVPMSPISDVTAFRSGRWPLAPFLRAIRGAVEWTIDTKSTFDFLGHPSCLYVADPEFRAIDLVCELVASAGNKAAIVDLSAFAQRARRRDATPPWSPKTD